MEFAQESAGDVVIAKLAGRLGISMRVARRYVKGADADRDARRVAGRPEGDLRSGRRHKRSGQNQRHRSGRPRCDRRPCFKQ